MKTFNFNRAEWYRFEKLCKFFGFKVETDARYTYSNLIETEHCFLRVIKNERVVCLAYLVN
jgi:hypothetical protein